MQVYMGSILQTKKRYVGHMHETVRDVVPTLDSKGIELVRRDSCPAVGKMMHRCLTTLFSTRSLTAVREYVQRQFLRILANRVSVQVSH
jgi:DNA polymerase zeta